MSGGGSAADERPDPDFSWEWTIEERLEERLDAEQIAARQEAHQRHAAAEPAEGERVQDPSHYTIRGWEHPHLLLPHEVFQALMTGFDPDPEIRNKQRELLREPLEARGYEADLFWAQLESVSSRYAALRHRDEDATEEERCRAAFTALESARTLFGRDHFDRFLYEAVAPGMSFSISTNAPDPSQRLRWIANGCR